MCSIVVAPAPPNRREVDEVEPQPVGRDERSRLLHVRAQHLPQRGVEQVRRGVIAPRRVARLVVNRGGHDVARLQHALGNAYPVRARPPGARRTSPVTCAVPAGPVDDRPAVGDLAAGFDIERRPLEDEEPGRPAVELGGLPPLFVEHGNHRNALHGRDV